MMEFSQVNGRIVILSLLLFLNLTRKRFSHRGIALLPIVSKVLERQVHRRLYQPV